VAVVASTATIIIKVTLETSSPESGSIVSSILNTATPYELKKRQMSLTEILTNKLQRHTYSKYYKRLSEGQ
tara:strand:- start:445 stop:657 length:213 start_codon:yes stop_codon:yes gene_type:complete